MRRVSLLLGIVFLATAVLAQTTALPQERQKLGGSDPTTRISREVMHELLMQPYYSVFDNLTYKESTATR